MPKIQANGSGFAALSTKGVGVNSRRSGPCRSWRFLQAAAGVIAHLRKVMGVPEQADEDVEQEFAALRCELDQHFPEFCKLFAGLLTRYIRREHQPQVFAALRREPVQRYLRAETEIEAGLRQLVLRLGAEMHALADECKLQD
jgi:hypothetical protein